MAGFEAGHSDWIASRQARGIVSEEYSLLPPGALGKWLSQRLGIWQERLLDASGLSRLAKDLGVDFWDQHVEEFWGLGLLRADLVISSRKLSRRGFMPVGQTPDGLRLYADERRPHRRPGGWGGAAKRLSLRPLPGQPWRSRSKSLRVLFHPYRYYVLHRLSELFDLPIARAQPLHSIKGFRQLVHEHLERFQRFTGSKDFLKRVTEWNAIAALAIAAEPCAHEFISGTISHPPGETISSQRRKIARHGRYICGHWRRIGIDRLEKVRGELCWHESRLDGNRDLHTLIRLSLGLNRLKPDGRVGGAMLLRNMSETIRRVTEKIFGIELPEEDEVGSSSIYRHAKVQLYGSHRILDGGPAAADSFLAQFQLKVGRRVHWYVEGDTEFGGLERLLGREPGIVIINLRGQFSAKRNKGVGFQEDLANDIRTRVCSVVSFDGDVDANLRALRVSVEHGKFFGRVYLSKPCFELANFTLTELRRVLWQMARDSGASSADRPKLQTAVSRLTDLDDLFRRAREVLPGQLGNVKKGAKWGEYLIKYATANPKFSSGAKRGETRPIVDAIEFALRAALYDYGTTFRLNRVEPSYDGKGNLVSVQLVPKDEHRRRGR